LIDEENREDEPGIGDINAVLDDDVDENMLENDIDGDDDVNENMLENDIDGDDDDDIVNPFNTVSEPDDDTNVEFNEEEDSEEG